MLIAIPELTSREYDVKRNDDGTISFHHKQKQSLIGFEGVEKINCLGIIVNDEQSSKEIVLVRHPARIIGYSLEPHPRVKKVFLHEDELEVIEDYHNLKTFCENK